MALGDRVKERIPTKLLVDWTNPNTDDASAVDDTYLGLAVTDAEAMWEDFVGIDYDETDPSHVHLAVRMVVAVLRAWTSDAAGQQQLFEQVEAMVQRWSTRRTKHRVTPTTSSTVAAELQCDDRSWSDGGRFRGISVRHPAARESCPPSDE